MTSHNKSNANQINDGKKHHAFYTTASYWREQENLWSKNHWHKEHLEFTHSGAWRDSIPGPGAYSPLASKPTGQGHKKVIYSAKSFAGEAQNSSVTLGSACFKKAYSQKPGAWWGTQSADRGRKTLKATATNRLHPFSTECQMTGCMSHENSYPVSICSCVATMAAPDKTKCDLCKIRLPRDEIENHKNQVCPRFRIRCEYCDNEIERMYVDRHADLECDARLFSCNWCEKDITRGNWAEHRDSDLHGCPQKPIHCEWCFNVVLSDKYDSHQETCTKRPNECPYCKDKYPQKNFKGHTESCPMRPVVCRFCRANLNFADARHHRDVCPSRPQVCKRCSATVEKQEWERHLAGCFLIEAAKLLAPKLKIQALGISAEKLPPNHLNTNAAAEYSKIQRTTVVEAGQRLIKVDKKGQVGAAGGLPGDFCYRIKIDKAIHSHQSEATVHEEETTTLQAFAQIVGEIRPGDTVTMWLRRPKNPSLELDMTKIKNIGDLCIDAEDVTISFFALGFYYNPHNDKDRRNYTEGEIRDVMRLSTGELTDLDFGDGVHKFVAPFWVEHGKNWEGMEGPSGLTGVHKGRGFTIGKNYSSPTKGLDNSPRLGMVNRALSARERRETYSNNIVAALATGQGARPSTSSYGVSRHQSISSFH